MSTSRLETFADGVFAIAATPLILDVHASGAIAVFYVLESSLFAKS